MKMFLISSSANPFRQSKTICAIVVEGIFRNISVKLFYILTSGLGKEVI